MNWHPTRVLPSLSILAGLGLACARAGGGAGGTSQARPTPAPPPPASMRADESARERATTLDQLLAGRISGVTVSRAPGGGIMVRMGGPT